MVFGSKRETKPDSLSREDVVGNLYPDSLTSEVDVAQSPSEFPRTSDRGNESVIDPHARFNGKYVSDRDLRIEGEAQGEIECQGTLIISPQARVRSAIKAHNVIVNGDYEGDVDCGGRFEIGSTGRVKGNVKTQVLVIKEGAHWEGGVSMTVGWWHTRDQIDALAAAVAVVLNGDDPTSFPPDRFDRIPDDLPLRRLDVGEGKKGR